MAFWNQFAGKTPGVAFTATYSFPRIGTTKAVTVDLIMRHRGPQDRFRAIIDPANLLLFTRTLIFAVTPGVGRITDKGIPPGTTISIEAEMTAELMTAFAASDWDYLIAYKDDGGLIHPVEYEVVENVF